MDHAGGETSGMVALRLSAMPIIALAHSAASTTGSSIAWITPAVAAATFVLTAGLTLLVQLYVVPMADTRKRRDDRWERNVLDLGELLTTQVGRLAQEARSAQSMMRFLYRDLEGVEGLDEKRLEKNRRESESKAHQATEEFRDVVETRVDWLEGRIRAIAIPRPPIIREFASVARQYQTAAMFTSYSPPDLDDRSDDKFDLEWAREREFRVALVKQIERLADLPHPPRAQRPSARQHWSDRYDLLGGPDP